jgi:hypothetical protein
MAMAQEFEFEPWPPDDVGKSRAPKSASRPKGGATADANPSYELRK